MDEKTKTLLDDYVESCFAWAEANEKWAKDIKDGVKPFDLSSNPPPPPPPPPNH